MTTRTTSSVDTVGRYIAQPNYDPTSFNRTTLVITRNTDNDKPLATTGTLVTNQTSTTISANGTTVSSSSSTSSTITVTVPGGGPGTVTLPWQTGTLAGGFFVGDVPGTILTAGRGYVSNSGDFFVYIFNTGGNKFGIVGGDPTPTGQFPTSGVGAYDIASATNGVRLPFANGTVGDDANLIAARAVSKVYAQYSSNLGPTVGQSFGNQRSTAFQSTISIAGSGAAQKSYMGVFIGAFQNGASNNGEGGISNNGVALTGVYTGSYRLGGGQQVGRLTSAASTADTGSGNAIYGTNTTVGGGTSMLITPDKVQTLYNTTEGGAVTSFTTTRTAQASYDQPYNSLTGTDYYAVTVLNKGATPSGLGDTRTDRTLSGYVGGMVDKLESGGSFSSRAVNGTVSLTTSATNNRASAALNFENRARSTSASFQLGGTTGSNVSTSAFIDDKTYALRDRPADVLSGTTTIGGRTGTDVTSNTVMVSYGAAGLGTTAATNPFIAAGVTPCACEFMTWGWWGGDIAYAAGEVGYNVGGRDRVNLATYVAGTLTTTRTLDGLRLANASATFSGHMIGNVNNNGNSYVAAGSYGASWSFGTQTGTTNVSFDGASFSGGISLNGGGPSFSTPTAITSTGVTRRNLTLNGSFMSATGGAVAGQAGNFGITGTSYTAAGTFAAKKS